LHHARKNQKSPVKGEIPQPMTFENQRYNIILKFL